MSKGLGRVQNKVLEVLRTETLKHESSNHPIYKEGWCDVGSVVYLIVHGIDCFEGTGLHARPSNAAFQSVWRALRLLEKKGLITSRKRIDVERWNGHTFIRGGRSFNKDIRLSVESKRKTV